MRRVVDFVFVFVVAFFFTACGGGGGGGTSGTPIDPTTTLNGIAVDNYISGTTVCIDTNKNNSCDVGETQTTTASNGTFSFSNVTPTDDMVIIAYGGTDAITGENFDYIIKNIATNKDSNNKVILSSLNTLITDYKFETNSTIAQSQLAVQNFISSNNLQNTIGDIMQNKSSTEFLKSLKIFQMVAAINDTNNSTESAKSFKAIAKAIKENINLKDTNASITVNRDGDNGSKIILSTIYKPVLLSKSSFTFYTDISSSNAFQIEAYDLNGSSLNYSLLNSKDSDDMNISSLGVLSFKVTPTNIINPTDANGDGIYEVDVNISNGITSLIKTFTVEVKKYNKSIVPVLLDTNISIEDNLTIGSIIGSIGLSSSGNDDGIIKYETVNTNNYFDINWTTGNIYKTADLNVTTGEHNTSILTIRAKNSAGWSSEKNATITIYDAGQLNSTATIANQTFSNIYENNSSQTVGTVTVLSTGGPTLTIDDFNITSGGADFNISTSGVITTKRAFNFETEPTHTLKVVAKNTNGWGNEATITVNIADVNEAPYINNKTYVVPDQNVSFEETSKLTFTLNDDDSRTGVSQNITIDVNSSNTGIVSVSKSKLSGIDGDTFDLNLTGVSPGSAVVTIKLVDANGTVNGGVDTQIYTFNTTVRSNGWKYYDERSNNNEHNISFDGITYTWKPDKQWYETPNTILMPVQILKSAKNAYMAGNFKEIAEGHYYVNKSEYIWDVNKSQTHTDLTKYKNANGVDNNITAKNNYFQHDAYHNFFVSMVTVSGYDDNTKLPIYKSLKYNDWTHTSSNFVDANDSNTSYATAENFSQYFNHTVNQITLVDANNTNISLDTECALMYGRGWRIPTAYEMGLQTDDEIVLLEDYYNTYIPAYAGNSEDQIFSSSKNGSKNELLSLRLLTTTSGTPYTWSALTYEQTGYLRCIYQP